jgi:predicted acetyltransferase
MAEQLVLRELTPGDRPVVERLWQLYRHDLSEFRGTHGPAGFRGSLPDEDGLYHGRGLVPFLEGDPDRAAYLFFDGPSPVGFAFVAGVAGASRLMHEFFLVRGARGRGLAQAAAWDVLSRHPGEWEIPFQENNVAAARFWRGVASTAAGDAWSEERRPVPGKPEVPPDVWLTLRVEA